MKHIQKFKITLLAMLLPFISNAQSWNITGNAGTTNSNFVGTTSNVDLRFRTNNVQRVTIKAGGNVGIGTTAPGSKFHISGGESSFHGKNSAIQISNTATGGTNWYLRSGATGTATPKSGFSIANELGYWLVIDSAGKVALNTTTTIDQFMVKSANNNNTTNIASFRSNDGTKGIAIGQNSISTVGTGAGEMTLSAGDSSLIIYNSDLVLRSDSCVNCGGIGPPCPLKCDKYHLYLNTPLSTTNVADIASIGNESSVIRARVLYSANQDIIGVNSTSTPAPGYGIGSKIQGGFIGVQSDAITPNSTDASYGGRFQATGAGNGMRYGVWSQATGSTTNNWAFYGVGSSFASGGTWQTSDEKIKKDITSIENSLDKLMNLHPSTYNFKTDEYDFMNLPKEKQYGFIAQDLEKVFPEMVKEIQQPLNDNHGNFNNNSFTFKGIRYDQLIPVLVSAIQEEHKSSEKINADVQKELLDKNELITMQQEQISILKTRLDQFENDLIKCCNNIQPSTKRDMTSDSNFDLPVLKQNAPNPFNENTVIKFYLPLSVKTAAIKINLLNGDLIKSYSIEQRGAGQLIISGKKLNAGTYLYSLVADDKTIESKLMMLTKE